MGRWLEPVRMTVNQWIALPDHPRQRDTARHAHKAEKRWLSVSDPIQSKVEAVRVGPCGKLYKLEGHTRGYMWANKKLARPIGDMVLVGIFECDNGEELLNAYNKVGSLGEGKTIADDVSGGCKQYNLELTCALLKKNQFGTALKWAEGIYDYATASHASSNLMADLIGKWLVPLQKIDALNPPSTRFNCTALAAMLVTIAKYQDAILPFWQGVIKNGGVQNGKKKDAVRQACIILDGTRGTSSHLRLMDSPVTRLIVCARHYLLDPMKPHEIIKPLDKKQLQKFRDELQNACMGGRFLD